MDDASPKLDLLFEAMAHPARRLMVKKLSYCPATPKEIAFELRISLQMVGKHLDILEEAGLIRRRKAGRINFVGFRSQTLRELQEWINQFRTEWGSEEETLENFIAYMTDEEPNDG